MEANYTFTTYMEDTKSFEITLDEEIPLSMVMNTRETFDISVVNFGDNQDFDYMPEEDLNVKKITFYLPTIKNYNLYKTLVYYDDPITLANLNPTSLSAIAYGS